MPADTDFARRTHHAAVRAVVELQFGRWDERQQDAFFDADWASAAFEMVLVDNVVAGYCAIENRLDDIHLRELVIDPRHQGKGVGTVLLAELQDKAGREGKPIRLGTLHRNRAAALYSRLGFQVVGATPTHAVMEWWPPSMPPDPAG